MGSHAYAGDVSLVQARVGAVSSVALASTQGVGAKAVRACECCSISDMQLYLLTI